MPVLDSSLASTAAGLVRAGIPLSFGKSFCFDMQGAGFTVTRVVGLGM